MNDLLKAIAEIADNRRPGWDAKIISALLTHCHELYRLETPTHSLIYQLGLWSQHETDIEAIALIIDGPQS